MHVTPYEDINELLSLFSKKVQKLFGNNLVGIYLTGSLSYGDFARDRSDIDLLVVLKEKATKEEFELIKKLHEEVGNAYPTWHHRTECSYIALDMLDDILPSHVERPYFGEGELYMYKYNNEWIINNYLLFNKGITLYGEDFKTLMKPVDIEEVKKACIRDVFKEWKPKLEDDAWLKNSHYKSYLILNLCRILYTLLQNNCASKKVSAEWVKKKFPQWKDLIEIAENWKYGEEIELLEETKNFIRFAIEKVEE